MQFWYILVNGRNSDVMEFKTQFNFDFSTDSGRKSNGVRYFPQFLLNPSSRQGNDESNNQTPHAPSFSTSFANEMNKENVKSQSYVDPYIMANPVMTYYQNFLRNKFYSPFEDADTSSLAAKSSSPQISTSGLSRNVWSACDSPRKKYKNKLNGFHSISKTNQPFSDISKPEKWKKKDENSRQIKKKGISSSLLQKSKKRNKLEKISKEAEQLNSRSYKCAYCPKTFSFYCHLNVHQRVRVHFLFIFVGSNLYV